MIALFLVGLLLVAGLIVEIEDFTECYAFAMLCVLFFLMCGLMGQTELAIMLFIYAGLFGTAMIYKGLYS